MRKTVEDEAGHSLSDETMFTEYDRDFWHRAQQIVKEVEDEFNKLGFIEVYKKYDKQEITEEEIEKLFDDAINKAEEPTRKTWNMMWKALSEKNCWYITYETGQFLHNRLMEFWYPNEEF